MKLAQIMLIVASMLTACTGSLEPPNPVLLVVGYSSGAGSRVALIRDRFGESGAVTEQLEFLPGSVRNLPAPAVDYDVTNRDRARDRLVVLSRGPAAAGQATGYLTFFSLQSIDPDNPVAFEQRAEFTISPATVTNIPDTLLNPGFCPARVQVTQNGSFVTVLNEPTLCNGRGQPSIDIFSLAGAQPRLLQRLTTGGAEDGGVGGGSFLATGGNLYLSQSPTQDLLYYAVSVPGGLRLEQATLPRPGAGFGLDDELPVSAVARVRTDPRQGNLVDLGRAGASGDERLVVLFEAGLANVEFAAEPLEDDVVPTATLSDNSFVIRDDRRETDATLFVGTPAAQRFSYVPVATDEGTVAAPENARVDAVDAVIEPTFGFVYFVAPGQVSIFDLSAYDVGERLRNPRAVSVPELGDTVPSFVTWTQAAPPATPQ